MEPVITPVDQFLNILIFAGFILGFGVILVFASIFAFKYWVWRTKFNNRKKSLENKVFLKIQIPEANEYETSVAEQIYSSLYGIKKGGGFFDSLKEQDHISFEVVASSESIDFYAVAPKELSNLVEKQINSAYPDAEIVKAKPWNIWTDDGIVEFSSLVLKKENYLPFNTYEDIKVDSMAVLTGAMSKLHPGEALAFQMIVRPADDKWQ